LRALVVMSAEPERQLLGGAASGLALQLLRDLLERALDLIDRFGAAYAGHYSPP